MPDYEKLYKIIFNGVTDAVDCMENGGSSLQAKELLIRSQQAAEEYFIESGEEEEGGAPSLYVLPHDTYSNKK